MKLRLVIFVVGVLGICSVVRSQSTGQYPDVTILASDQHGMTFEVRPVFGEDREIVYGDRTYTVPQVLNGLQPFNAREGEEDIRSRVIAVALPGHTGNTVDIVSSDYTSVSGYSLAPIPTITMIDSYGTEQKNYGEDFSRPNEFYPSPMVRWQSVGMVKGIVVGMLQIAPYQYNASLHELRKYTRIVVRVSFGTSRESYHTTNIGWAKSSLLNYPVAMNIARASSALRKTAVENSVCSTGTWYKLEVVEDGMYKIDASYLATLGIDRASLSSIYDIKIFGADGRAIPPSLTANRPDDLPQCAVKYVDHGTTTFDEGDYILFYGQGVTGWDYSASSKSYSHYTNPYTNSNYYFLAVGSSAPVKQMKNIVVSGGSGGNVTTSPGMLFFDEEKFNFNQSGLDWVSAPFNPGDSRVVSNKLNGWIPGSSIQYKYFLYSRANVSTHFTIEESGTVIGNPSISQMSDAALASAEGVYANSTSGQITAVPALTDERSNVKFTYVASGNVANGYIDWLEEFYTYSLDAVDNQIRFRSPDTNGVVTFGLSSFSSNDVNVFDVSDVNNVDEMQSQTGQFLGSLTFADSLSSGHPNTYWAGTADAYRYPKSFVKIPTSNLHGYKGAEFIVITSGEFKSEAARLKAHKESLPVPISTVVVDVDTIYTEFGIGMPDPVALRDFLKYAVDHWQTPPQYVLFFGDASYDYKSILQTDKSWVPTMQSQESNSKINTYGYEDFFAYLDPQSPHTLSIAHGRLCPRSESDAKFFVDRIIQYESEQTYSPWKNTITIIADDIWTPEEGHQFEDFHVRQAEALAQLYTPKSFDIKKIYIGEYQTVFTSSGRRKPDARQAIIDQVNNGTLVLNFTGHGNPTVWAHESVLTLDDVKTQFSNADKLTFIVAATCDWGRFDEAGAQSSAEEVVANRKGGAIGVFSATRAVYSDLNFATNTTFYANLFGYDPSLPLGDVNLLTKNSLDGSFTRSLINKRKYFLLGDPTLRLAIPQGLVSVDSINNGSIAVLDTIKSLEKVTVKATVQNSSHNVDPSYNGTALVSVYDAEQNKQLQEVPGFSYKLNGPLIYRGQNTIRNGRVEASFIVPKDISYENKNGRISIYYSNATGDGRGYSTNFIVGGTASNVAQDTIGPSISIYFDNTAFRSGDVVTDNPTLIVDLTDSSGINSSGSGIGHRIEAWLDGSNKSIDLTEYYEGKKDSYQEGTAQYAFTNLSEGNHTIKVRGWDVYNNSSTAEAYFSVTSGDRLSIHQLYNFPNPMTTSTAFTFQVNKLVPIDAEIKIYTVSGRLIRTLRKFGISDRFVKINWDRRDEDGDVVGNGIYFYRVTAKTIDGEYSSRATGKLAVVR